MKDFSYITNAHPSFIESLYNDYITDPNQVDPEYKKFFEGFGIIDVKEMDKWSDQPKLI